MQRSSPAAWIVIGSIVLLFGLYVWPTKYRHIKQEGGLTRENRINGCIEALSYGTWENLTDRNECKSQEQLDSEAKLAVKKKKAEEIYLQQKNIVIANIDATSSFVDNEMNIRVYNGSNCPIKSVIVNIISEESERRYGPVVFSRGIAPLSTGEGSVEVFNAYYLTSNDSDWEWLIDDAEFSSSNPQDPYEYDCNPEDKLVDKIFNNS